MKRTSVNPKSGVRQPSGERQDLGAVIAAAQHIWVAVAFVFAWLHFDYVQQWFRRPDWQLYVLYLSAVSAIAARYLTGARHGSEAWHRALFDFLIIFFIALGVNLTGGIRSDLWLLLFIFLIAETIATGDRGIVPTDVLALSSYVVAIWPRVPNQAWAEMLATRLFFLILVASIARTLAREERRRQEDLGALREALLVSDERRRLARELHDGVGHVLTRVILSLELARRNVRTDPVRADDQLAQQASALRGAMEEMRQLVATLRIDDSPEFDLRSALTAFAAQSPDDVPRVTVSLPEGAIPLSQFRQYHMARLVQEAMTNCLRHSRATEVSISVRVFTQPLGGSRVVAEVVDNGEGFDPEQASAHGNGLRGMLERIEPFDGKLLIESEPGHGARIAAEMPGDL